MNRHLQLTFKIQYSVLWVSGVCLFTTLWIYKKAELVFVDGEDTRNYATAHSLDENFSERKFQNDKCADQITVSQCD